MLESRKAAGLAKLAGSITKLDQHDDLITKDPFWLRLALHNGTILRFPIEWPILSCVASYPMCLEEQDFEYFFQLTKAVFFKRILSSNEQNKVEYAICILKITHFKLVRP